MPGKKAGVFKQRMAASQDFDDGAFENMYPPSRAERMQTMWTVATIGIALAILGVGMLLRFTVFAKKFEPAPFVPPVATATPQATATPSPTELATPTPEPSVAELTPSSPVPSVVATPATTTDGEPITPSLSETNGKVVVPR